MISEGFNPMLPDYLLAVVGWRLPRRCRTQEWREALEEAVLPEFPHGVRGQELKLGPTMAVSPASGLS